MRLTTYADYSLRLLIYVAVQGDRLATIPAVAESYGISRHHLVKVAHQLGVKGYLATTRGKNGGLRLAHSTESINIGDVVRTMEPDMALVPCFEPIDAPCPIYTDCLLRSAMEDARRAFLEVLDRYTLADLVKPRHALQNLLQIISTS